MHIVRNAYSNVMKNHKYHEDNLDFSESIQLLDLFSIFQ